MNILVINGSPKGKNSITLQTALYLEKCFPSHNFEYLHAGQRIHALEKDFSPALTAIEKADMLLFVYPVYTFLAPSQLHLFLHLLAGSGMDLTGKTAAQISTSKHFYDVTAYRYVRESLQDMGLCTVRGLMADMEDLTKPQGRSEAVSFFRRALFETDHHLYEDTTRFAPELPAIPVFPAKEAHRSGSGVVAIVSDTAPDDTQLNAMVERFRAILPMDSKVINIRNIPFHGGCLGCLQCAADGKCVYNDGFDELLRREIQTCSATVYAFRIEEHSMGFRFKRFDDRQFCNGHRTVTMGTPVGYLIAGDFSREENLRMVLDARAQVGGNFHAGYADDRIDPNTGIEKLALSITDAITEHRTEPKNFYGTGGGKIFRDLIWQMRGIMKADHRFYKQHGFYRDMPHRKIGTMLSMKLVGMLMKLPQAKSKMIDGMLAPYKKALEQTPDDLNRK